MNRRSTNAGTSYARMHRGTDTKSTSDPAYLDVANALIAMYNRFWQTASMPEAELDMLRVKTSTEDCESCAGPGNEAVLFRALRMCDALGMFSSSAGGSSGTFTAQVGRCDVAQLVTRELCDKRVKHLSGDGSDTSSISFADFHRILCSVALLWQQRSSVDRKHTTPRARASSAAPSGLDLGTNSEEVKLRACHAMLTETVLNLALSWSSDAMLASASHPKKSTNSGSSDNTRVRVLLCLPSVVRQLATAMPQMRALFAQARRLGRAKIERRSGGGRRQQGVSAEALVALMDMLGVKDLDMSTAIAICTGPDVNEQAEDEEHRTLTLSFIGFIDCIACAALLNDVCATGKNERVATCIASPAQRIASTLSRLRSGISRAVFLSYSRSAINTAVDVDEEDAVCPLPQFLRFCACCGLLDVSTSVGDAVAAFRTQLMVSCGQRNSEERVWMHSANELSTWASLPLDKFLAAAEAVSARTAQASAEPRREATPLAAGMRAIFARLPINGLAPRIVSPPLASRYSLLLVAFFESKSIDASLRGIFHRFARTTSSISASKLMSKHDFLSFGRAFRLGSVKALGTETLCHAFERSIAVSDNGMRCARQSASYAHFVDALYLCATLGWRRVGDELQDQALPRSSGETTNDNFRLTPEVALRRVQMLLLHLDPGHRIFRAPGTHGRNAMTEVALVDVEASTSYTSRPSVSPLPSTNRANTASTVDFASASEICEVDDALDTAFVCYSSPETEGVCTSQYLRMLRDVGVLHEPGVTLSMALDARKAVFKDTETDKEMGHAVFCTVVRHVMKAVFGDGGNGARAALHHGLRRLKQQLVKQPHMAASCRDVVLAQLWASEADVRHLERLQQQALDAVLAPLMQLADARVQCYLGKLRAAGASIPHTDAITEGLLDTLRIVSVLPLLPETDARDCITATLQVVVSLNASSASSSWAAFGMSGLFELIGRIALLVNIPADAQISHESAPTRFEWLLQFLQRDQNATVVLGNISVAPEHRYLPSTHEVSDVPAHQMQDGCTGASVEETFKETSPQAASDVHLLIENELCAALAHCSDSVSIADVCEIARACGFLDSKASFIDVLELAMREQAARSTVSADTDALVVTALSMDTVRAVLDQLAILASVSATSDSDSVSQHLPSATRHLLLGLVHVKRQRASGLLGTTGLGLDLVAMLQPLPRHHSHSCRWGALEVMAAHERALRVVFDRYTREHAPSDSLSLRRALFEDGPRSPDPTVHKAEKRLDGTAWQEFTLAFGIVPNLLDSDAARAVFERSCVAPWVTLGFGGFIEALMRTAIEAPKRVMTNGPREVQDPSTWPPQRCLAALSALFAALDAAVGGGIFGKMKLSLSPKSERRSVTSPLHELWRSSSPSNSTKFELDNAVAVLKSDPEALRTLFLQQRGLESLFRRYSDGHTVNGASDDITQCSMSEQQWEQFISSYSIFSEPWVDDQAVRACFRASSSDVHNVSARSLSFPDFNMCIARVAFAIFRDEAFSEEYPLPRDKIRLLLFKLDEPVFDGIERLLAMRATCNGS